MELILTAFCPGKVKGQGSLNFYGFRKNGTAIIRGTDDQYAWRDQVRDVIKLANSEGLQIPRENAVAVDLLFVYARPKDHYRTNGELKDWAKAMHWNISGSGIDVDKSERLVNDALTYSEIIADDKQIAMLRGEKIYVNEEFSEPGVHIKLWAL